MKTKLNAKDENDIKSNWYFCRDENIRYRVWHITLAFVWQALIPLYSIISVIAWLCNVQSLVIVVVIIIIIIIIIINLFNTAHLYHQQCAYLLLTYCVNEMHT